MKAKLTKPPMGWNSWDCYGASVTEEEVRRNAEYMAKNLKDTCVPRMAPANSLQCGLVIGTVICSSLMTWKRSALVKDY